jgi:predicted metalloprotease with PDZ domain
VAQASHEFFHVWNVKRIRPVEMWPYDYARENVTPLLWVSEGFTNYYSNLASYRAGFKDSRDFVDEVARGIAEVEANEARRYISASDSSTSTWIGYATAQPFAISYYSQGRNLAALLDLSIRHDTGGASGLDDVMRALYADFYQRGRGFSSADLIRVINRIAGKPYEVFFSRYVSGVDVPPYDTIFGYAGYQAVRTTLTFPNLGVNLNERGGVTGVPPGYDAAAAPLRPGDFITSIDGETLEGRGGGAVFRMLGNKAGSTVKLKIRRGNDERELDLPVASVEIVTYRLVESASPTPEQLKIREGWLKR